MELKIGNILKKMPKNLTQIEKARYLYLELGKYFSYNIEFAYADERFKRDIYEEEIQISKEESKQEKVVAVCKQVAIALEKLFQKLSIESETLGYEDGETYHVDTMATIDGKRYLFNLMGDVMRIQKGFKTNDFASQCNKFNQQFDTIDREKLKKIDMKLGYCKHGFYMDDAIALLKEEIKDEEKFLNYIFQSHPEEEETMTKDKLFGYKMDYIFQYIRNNQLEEDKMNIVEICNYYKVILEELLKPEELANIKNYKIYFDEANKREYTMIYKVNIGGDLKYYCYFDKKRGFEKTSKEELLNARKKRNMDFLRAPMEQLLEER